MFDGIRYLAVEFTVASIVWIVHFKRHRIAVGTMDYSACDKANENDSVLDVLIIVENQDDKFPEFVLLNFYCFHNLIIWLDIIVSEADANRLAELVPFSVIVIQIVRKLVNDFVTLFFREVFNLSALAFIFEIRNNIIFIDTPFLKLFHCDAF